MPTLTPTATEEARSVPQEMTCVDPDRVLGEAERSAFLQGSGLNGPFIADLLSDMLAHERCATHLYRSVAGRTQNPMLRRRYEEFGGETLEHVEILESLITRMGGDPMYVSPAARATEKADMGLLESTFMLAGSVDIMTQELVMLDAVLLGEAKDHANWSCLAKLADNFPAGEAQDAIRRAVGQVEPQEDEHLGWAQDARARMIAMQAKSSAMASVGAKAEEAMARVRSWFE